MRPDAVRVIALGNTDRGDDGAALEVGTRVGDLVPVVTAGRPGPGLLDLLPVDRPCVLMDVTCSGAPSGTIHRLPLSELDPALLPDLRISSHGFGAGEALALARTLGRRLPVGFFLGIEGESYELGGGFSPAVEEKLAAFEALLRDTIRTLTRSGASTPAHAPTPQQILGS